MAEAYDMPHFGKELHHDWAFILQQMFCSTFAGSHIMSCLSQTLFLMQSLFFQILGCVRAVAHNGMMEIGPIAVHPEFQGQGYGSRLMDTVENRSNAEKCTVGVVSCREDVIPFFLKRGYKVGHFLEGYDIRFCLLCRKFLTNKRQ